MVTELLSLSRRFDVEDLKAPLQRGTLAELAACGAEVRFSTNLPEKEQVLQKALITALGQCDILLIVGGLGPKNGDLVKRTLCEGLGKELSLHQPSLERMKQFYCLAGQGFPEDAQTWCAMPDGARVFLNSVGYLSGFALVTAEQVILCLPDSPPELYAMLGQWVYPLLREFTGRRTETMEFYTYGPTTEELYSRLEGSNASPYTGISAFSWAGTGTVRLVGQPVELSVLTKRVRDQLGSDCFSEEAERSLLQVSAALCCQKEWKLAVAESGTGLFFSRSMQEAAGEEELVLERLVASSAKSRQRLQVDEREVRGYGVCSHEVTLAMAIGACKLPGCNVGVSLTKPRLDKKQQKAGGPEPPIYYAVCLEDRTWWGQVEPCTDQRLTAVLEVANLLRLLSKQDAATWERGVPAAAAVIPAGEAPPPPRSTGILPHRSDPIGEQVRKCIFLLAAVALVGSGGYLGYTKWRDQQNKQQNQQITELIKPPEELDVESSSSLLPEGYLPQFEELYLINEHLAGYLEIPGSEVKYPVVQYGDNEYYLNRDFYRKENRHGVPFVDYRNELSQRERNTILYGHNLRDGQMFGELLGYRELAYYQDHPVITFNSVYEEANYKVLAVFITNTREQDGEVFDYLGFLNGDEEEFAQYVAEVTARSLLRLPVDVQEGDTLLTLSTCTYEFTDARFVVVARKVRLGENAAVDVESAAKNDDPLMPAVWYDLYGGWAPTDPWHVSVESASGEGEIPIQPVVAQAEEPTSSSSSASDSAPAVSSSSQPSEPSAVSSSQPPPPPESSSVPPASSSEASSSSEPAVSSSEPEQSSQAEEEDPEEEWEDEEELEQDFDETLFVTSGGKRVEMDARELLARIVQNETGGNLEPEAMKAQAVATYSYIKFNNQRNIAPSVTMKNSVNSRVYNAVDEVLGVACYYRGSYANTTYHSVSCGATASAQSVWGGTYPYLVSVDSEWDDQSPYYKGTYTISADDFADRVWDVYHIDLQESSDDPEDWVEIESEEDGGYVGVVSLGGYTKSQGGSVSSGTTITGRSVRESLLSYKLRSTCFEVSSDGDSLTFTTYGYGHGVGMSQWGAHYMAQEGYDYQEILEHYYSGITVE